MEKTTHEIIKDIKAEFRRFMNGAISHSMRDKGLDYKVNFGIEYPRLKEIAALFSPSHEVAQALWKENIRECKIMAMLLQPVEEFDVELAELWIEEMKYPELAEYATMNLFQHLPDASDAAFRWIADDREYFQACGFLLFARLFMKGGRLEERSEAEFIDQVIVNIENDAPFVQRSAALALKKFIAQYRGNYKKISAQLSALMKSSNPLVASLAEDIKAEATFGY